MINMSPEIICAINSLNDLILIRYSLVNNEVKTILENEKISYLSFSEQKNMVYFQM